MPRTIREVNNTKPAEVERYYTITREENDGRTRFALMVWADGDAANAVCASAVEAKIDLLTERARWHRIHRGLEETGIAAGWTFKSRAEYNRERWRDQRNDFLFGGMV